MLGKIFTKKEKETSKWQHLTTLGELDKMIQQSNQVPVAVFKHSIRCSISAMALARFESDFGETLHFEPYYLDLIAFREVSNEIAEQLGVTHQSPQAILFYKGEVLYTASHNGISFEEVNTLAAGIR